MIICDFCQADDVAWDYETTPFVLHPGAGAPGYIDDGQWAACDECMVFIESGEPGWVPVIRRACLRAHGAFNVSWAIRLLDAFKEHRCGGPWPVRVP